LVAGWLLFTTLEEAVMRRWLLTAVLAFVVVAMLAPPVLAQAPAPTVTITGLFDQVTSAGRNQFDGNYARDNDRQWYARTRFRPDFTFQVGRTKAVLGIEIDLMYGQAGTNDGGFPGNATGGNGAPQGVASGGATGGGLDLNTDVAGLFEVKWIYTEFDLTGKDSLLPFIPFLTVARAGGQPFGTIANYKVYYANGDFAGLDMYSTFTPEIKNHLAFVIVEDQIAGGNRSAATARTNRGEDYAWIISPEFTPTKGLDLKPMFSWFHADGVTSGASRRNATNRRTVSAGGGTSGAMNTGASLGGGNAAGDATDQEQRYTIGLDARWRVGPFGLDPTIAYQWGTYNTQAHRTNGTIGRVEGDASAWLFDVIGSYQLGPLLLEMRGLYTPGNKARDNLSLSKRYFEVLDTDTGVWAGWTSFFALNANDFASGGGGQNAGTSTNVGYDRYGRGSLGFRATYSFTPAFSLYGILTANWSAEKVDTDTGCPALSPAQGQSGCPARLTVNDQSWVEGDSSYLGTDFTIGFNWRFAPNTSLGLNYSYLFAGDALSTSEVLNGVLTKRDARDAYFAAALLRLAF
jgi:hypothetical protein